MTNDDMRIILERGLGIPVAESDAAWILASVEGKLRNENSAQQSMHPTSGTRHDLLARFWLRALSALKHFTSPPTRG